MKLLCLAFIFFELVLPNELLLRYRSFEETYQTVLKRIICCHGNHAISHISPNGVILGAILSSIEGGPTKQFDAHEELS